MLQHLQATQADSLNNLRMTLTTTQSEMREQMIRQLGDISIELRGKQDALREDVLVKLAQMLAERDQKVVNAAGKAVIDQLTDAVARQK